MGGSSSAAAAETGFPKPPRLDTIADAKKAIQKLVVGEHVVFPKPKPNAPKFVWTVFNRRTQISRLSNRLRSSGRWACRTANAYEEYDKWSAIPGFHAAVYAQTLGVPADEANELRDLLDSLPGSVIRETVSAACD